MSTEYIVDHSESERIAGRMKKAVVKLHEMAPHVGSAQQVRKFTSDRKQNLLSRYMLPSIKAGESAAAAETIARANPSYQEELEALAGQHEAAERVIATWSATQSEYEATRSLLSFSKATLEHVE